MGTLWKIATAAFSFPSLRASDGLGNVASPRPHDRGNPSVVNVPRRLLRVASSVQTIFWNGDRSVRALAGHGPIHADPPQAARQRRAQWLTSRWTNWLTAPCRSMTRRANAKNEGKLVSCSALIAQAGTFGTSNRGHAECAADGMDSQAVSEITRQPELLRSGDR